MALLRIHILLVAIPPTIPLLTLVANYVIVVVVFFIIIIAQRTHRVGRPRRDPASSISIRPRQIQLVARVRRARDAVGGVAQPSRRSGKVHREAVARGEEWDSGGSGRDGELVEMSAGAGVALLFLGRRRFVAAAVAPLEAAFAAAKVFVLGLGGTRGAGDGDGSREWVRGRWALGAHGESA